MLRAIYALRPELAKVRSSVEGIGSPQITVGLIKGGINTNVVPDRVTLRLDRRLIPEENGAEVEATLTKVITESVAGKPGITVRCTRVMLAEPLKPIAGIEPLVEALEAHGSRVLGHPVKPHGVPLYTDGRHYSARGIPTVLYGAGPRTIQEARGHAADERLSLADLDAATRVVALTLADVLRRA